MEEALEKRLGELLLQLKSGDVSALAEIDSIVGKRLRVYANSFYLQKADVDDSIQALLYKLYYASKRYKEKKHALAWVFKIYKNMVKDNKKRKVAELLILTKQAKEELLKNNGGDEYIFNYIFLNDLMSKLDKDECELLRCVFLVGLSYSETAEILKRPKSTIEYRVNKLKEKIKNMK